MKLSLKVRHTTAAGLASGVIALAMAITGSAHATTPISIGTNSYSEVRIFEPAPVSNIVSNTDGAFGLGNSASSTQSISNFDAPFVSVFSQTDAQWFSADEGVFSLQGGWYIPAFSTDEDDDTVIVRSTAEWNYRFTATGDGVFSAHYVTSNISGEDFGLSLLRGSGNVPIGPFSGSNMLAVNIVNGQNYDMRFNIDSSIGYGGIFDYDIGVQSRADVSWQIVYGNPGPGPIPEPTIWALMIGGFGMAGAMLRRRRTVAV